MINISSWSDICSIVLFLSMVEYLLLLIAKCVEIYIFGNTGDDLILVQLLQVVCILWTD